MSLNTMIGRIVLQWPICDKMKGVVISGTLFIGFLLVFAMTFGVAQADVFSLELTGLTASTSPFSVTDVNNVFGEGAGTQLALSVPNVSLLTGSGIAGANQGAIDTTAGTFHMNWGFLATGTFTDPAGNVVGTTAVSAVLPETGTFNPTTMTGTSQTDGAVGANMTLFDRVGRMLMIPDVGITVTNNNSFGLLGGPGGTLDGKFLPNPPELSVRFPDILGGSQQSGALSGGFQVTAQAPEPAALLVVGSGMAWLGLAHWRRRRQS